MTLRSRDRLSLCARPSITLFCHTESVTRGQAPSARPPPGHVTDHCPNEQPAGHDRYGTVIFRAFV
eukprot:935304-Rhodomonas_salina.1